MSKRLNQYCNRLSPSLIADGMNAAIRNANRLLQDASILLDQHRYPGAASLAILSIEESGKVSILRELAVAENENDVAECWRNYRSHTKKNAMWLLPQLVANGARKLEDFRSLYNKESDHPYVLDQIKQIGFYTDCLGAAHWSVPEEIIDEPLAKSLLQIAKVLTRKHEVTAKEIELWIKHLAPVWKKDYDLMKIALADWYADMQNHGLAENGINEIEQFVRGFRT